MCKKCTWSLPKAIFKIKINSHCSGMLWEHRAILIQSYKTGDSPELDSVWRQGLGLIRGWMEIQSESRIWAREGSGTEGWAGAAQQGEAKQLEQAPGCIPEPFEQQEMNNSELWEGLYQSVLVLCSVKWFKWCLLNIQFLALPSVQCNFPTFKRDPFAFFQPSEKRDSFWNTSKCISSTATFLPWAATTPSVAPEPSWNLSGFVWCWH